MKYLSLKIFKDSKLVKTKIFTDDQISIGSSEGLSLQLEGISPWHVLIERKHDIFCILDLNSETGTKLNGEQITDETALQSGSIIQIGDYEIHFFVGPPKEKSVSKASSQTAVPSSQPEIHSQVSAPPQSEIPSEKTVYSPQPEIPSQATVHSSQPEVPSEKTVYSPEFVSKPKGFWNTYAPSSRLKSLDDYLEPSIGNLIEVNVCWRERILKTYYFYKKGDVFIGGNKDCQVKFPNMQNRSSYKLLTISSGAQIHLSGAVQGMLFQGKNKSTRVSHALKGNQNVTLKPYEMVRLDFNSNLKLYIRLIDKPAIPPLTGLLNLRVSEALALLFAFLLTGLLFFFGTLYAPAFLTEDIEFIEKDTRVAQVIFNKKPEERTIVKYELSDKTTRSVPIKTIKKTRPKKLAVKTPKVSKKKPVKKFKAPKKGRQGKIAAVAKGKRKATKNIKVGSARPGGSIKTGKAGSSAQTVAKDPTKLGVLGILGGGGVMDKLDKGASGPGGLVGLADQFSGGAGTEDSYEGKGLGTRTKELSSGQGTAIQGISGIKTKGKGLGVADSGRGGLGERGRMSIEFSTDDIDVTAGEIDREAILRVIRRNQNKFQRCYQLALNQKASIQGNLSMRWMISANGKGRNARAAGSDIDSDTLKNCVAGVLESLIFPEPPSGQIPDVTFTFRFYL